MATFAELRDRLSPDVHKMGKQFERVCKWLLETDPRYANRLSKVWLWDDWPGRWGPDCGIDLVAEDLDGITDRVDWIRLLSTTRPTVPS